MEKEEFLRAAEYFIKLVRWGIDGERQNREAAPEKPEGVAWEHIFRLSERHSLSAVTWRAVEKCREKPPRELLEKWEHAYRVCVHADILQGFAWEEIQADFSEHGLKILPLKGLNLKKLYPESALRLMGDLDILYEKDRFAEVKAELEKLGYTYRKESAGSNHQVFERAPVTHVEMHRGLLPAVSPFLEYYENVWERALATDSPCVFRFSREDEYIFLLIHGYKHFSRAGSGVRTVADFYLFSKTYGGELDREQIARELAAAERAAEKNGLLGEPLKNYEQELVRQVENWFAGDGVVIDETGAVILSDGVYGTAEKMWRKESEQQGRGKYLFRRLFPSFKTMKEMFPRLQKLPFLLPVYYLRRLFKALFFRRKAVAREYRFVKEEAKRDKNRKRDEEAGENQ